MQNQSNDTPRIIGLLIAIVAVLAYVIWQYVRATRPAEARDVRVPTVSENSQRAATGSAPAQVATAIGAGINPNAGPGQMRYFSEVLDSEMGTNIAPGRPDAFRQFKPPAERSAPVVTPTRIPAGEVTLPRRDEAFRLPPLPAPGQNETPAGGMPAVVNSVEIKLDGVVLGNSPEAVLTIVRRSSEGPDTEGERTLYLRVGDRLPFGRHRIVQITEAGLILQGWPEIWTVGQTRSFNVRAGQSSETGNRPSVRLPSGLMSTLPPPSLTP
ncbi:MAG: hypothetical protein RMJ43_01115 [Chloroherpetonaceae bacterium]|nr:hypothetical protein [Chthonomonadaceae bacterium]MDW8206409.1 hypothetical protein [Chloroherpetonaceae bacterium]